MCLSLWRQILFLLYIYIYIHLRSVHRFDEFCLCFWSNLIQTHHFIYVWQVITQLQDAQLLKHCRRKIASLIIINRQVDAWLMIDWRWIERERSVESLHITVNEHHYYWLCFFLWPNCPSPVFVFFIPSRKRHKLGVLFLWIVILILVMIWLSMRFGVFEFWRRRYDWVRFNLG